MITCERFRCIDVGCYSCRSHACDACGRGYGEHEGAVLCADDFEIAASVIAETKAAVEQPSAMWASSRTWPVAADRDVKPDNVLPPGLIVLVTLRWSERGRRGEVREYEQVRVGTVAMEPHDKRVQVAVDVPGCGRRVVPVDDVEDAGCGVRRAP